MNRKRLLAAIGAGGCLVVLVLGGCSSEARQKILPYFFDGVPREGQPTAPPTRRVRRDLLREIEELKRERDTARAAAAASARGPSEDVKLPVEQAENWEQAAKLLPKDTAGQVDWVQAVKAGAIVPRAGFTPKASELGVLDMDVDLASSGSKLFSVTFPHAAHTQWLSCASCHPAIFPLKRQAEPTVITMAKIREGRYCGACHGRVAFGLEDRCVRCHAKVPATTAWRPSEKPRKPIEAVTVWKDAEKLLPTAAGGPDWTKALAEGVIAPRPGVDPKAEDEAVFPLDVQLVPADNPAFKVVFPHEAHTTLLSCATCHPAIFKMAAGADPITMEKIFAGEYCGRCHGKVAFPPATACGRCHPVMAGG